MPRKTKPILFAVGILAHLVVSSEFVDGILSARVTARESFEDILAAAKTKSQLVFSDPSNAGIRAACQAVTPL
jgi:hypothetical protein